MHIRIRTLSRIFCPFAAPVLLLGALVAAQTKPATNVRTTPTVQLPTAAAPAPTERDFAETQRQLIKLLRMNPTLTTVVEHDPSLLSNQEYVSRNNPQLAQFLASHPEIA